MSYTAVIARIKNIRSVAGKDRIRVGSVLGNQVIVGLDTQENDLGVFFSSDSGQLSEPYLKANDLVSRVDENGKKAGGYFGNSGKVKTQKFGGEKSEGYFAPLESLKFTGFDIDTLEEGFEFTELNDVPICKHYYSDKTLRAMQVRVPKIRIDNRFFPEHMDTKQFRNEAAKIPINSFIFISLKQHGTSGRYAYIQEEIVKPNPWYRRIFKLKPKTEKVWKHAIGTRRTILKESGDGYYKDTNFREEIVKDLEGQIYKNLTMYFEIVGYQGHGGPPIMPVANLSGLKDKSVKKYGDKMVYSYGCHPDSAICGAEDKIDLAFVKPYCEKYIYRITYTTPDGHILEMPWPQVKSFCEKLNVKTVMELHEPFIYDGDLDKLTQIVESLCDGDDPIDPTHCREGVVIRVETPDGGTYFLKHKGFTFRLIEGHIKEKEDVVDIEEAS